ncbi:MAG: proton-conducting transporter membrane subunit [Patescibacteria group bacterium]|jgi:hydrogenase-4 component F
MNYFLELWNTDVLTLFMLGVAAVITVAGVLMSVNVFQNEVKTGTLSPKRQKYAIGLLVASIIFGAIGLMANHLGLLWLSIQGLSAVGVASLVLHERNNTKELIRRFGIRAAFGAIIGGVGVGILKIVAMQHGVSIMEAGMISSIMDVVGSFAPWQVQSAFVLVFLGFGVSIGIAPMHFGLSELYSKMLSPLVALIGPMSMLVGVFGILRCREIVDVALADGGVWTGKVLMIFGLITLFIFAFSLLRQNNYKKFFFEISCFHVGLILCMSGFGFAGTIPALMHLAAVAILASAFFSIAGMLHATYKTTKCSGIRQLSRMLPITTVLLGLLIVGSAFFPIASTFTSTMIGIGYGLQMHPFFAALVIFVLIVFVLACVMFYIRLVLQQQEETVLLFPANWKISIGIVMVFLCMLAGFGWYIGTQDGVKFFVDSAQLIVEL